MKGQTDPIVWDLRQKLTEADDRIEALNARIIGWHDHDEQDVRGALDEVRKRIALGHAALVAAQVDIGRWIAAQRSETSKLIATWKEMHELGRLESRAETAERCAVAALCAVVAALDEAERTSLEAWLARRDARSASIRAAGRED